MMPRALRLTLSEAVPAPGRRLFGRPQRSPAEGRATPGREDVRWTGRVLYNYKYRKLRPPVLQSSPPSASSTLKTADRVGFAASFLCAIHCALVPVVLGLVPALGLKFGGWVDIDQAFVVFATLLGLTTLTVGYRRHRAFRAWALLVPAGWYLFAPQPQLQGCETALWLLLGTNAAMLAVNTLMRIRMCFAANGRMACVMKARSALKKYSFRQLVTLGMTALLGVLLLG